MSSEIEKIQKQLVNLRDISLADAAKIEVLSVAVSYLYADKILRTSDPNTTYASLGVELRGALEQTDEWQRADDNFRGHLKMAAAFFFAEVGRQVERT